MKTMRDLALLLTSAVFCAAHTYPNCNENIQIPVSASAVNKAFAEGLNATDLLNLAPESLQSLLASTPDTHVAGEYTIAARYCEPERFVASRANTLQILVHGITFDRRYFSGLGPPGAGFDGDKYSYISAASKAGYPTLSIDRICNGASSHPSSLLACQLPLNAATLNEVILAARAGSLPSISRSFSTIIYASHSLGSLTANMLENVYRPNVDAYILTGFTPFLITGTPGVAATIPSPASFVDPARFGTLDPFYLLATDEEEQRGLVYYPGGYDPALFNFDYETRTTVPIGELLTALLGQAPVPGFKGDLLVLNGQRDQLFCARSPLDGILGGNKGDCGTGDQSFSVQVGTLLYPNARTFEWKQYERTSHNMNLHFDGEESFRDALAWLETRGY